MIIIILEMTIIAIKTLSITKAMLSTLAAILITIIMLIETGIRIIIMNHNNFRQYCPRTSSFTITKRNDVNSTSHQFPNIFLRKVEKHSKYNDN